MAKVTAKLMLVHPWVEDNSVWGVLKLNVPPYMYAFPWKKDGNLVSALIVFVEV
jgi:hypothetical protein